MSAHLMGALERFAPDSRTADIPEPRFVMLRFQSSEEGEIASGEIALATTALPNLAAGDVVRGAVFFAGNDGRIAADENRFRGARIA